MENKFVLKASRAIALEAMNVVATPETFAIERSEDGITWEPTDWDRAMQVFRNWFRHSFMAIEELNAGRELRTGFAFYRKAR